MTKEEAAKMLTAKVECMERDINGTNYECNTCFCDNCNLHYAQGTMGEQIEALRKAIEALKKQIPQKTQKDLQPTCNRCDVKST